MTLFTSSPLLVTLKKGGEVLCTLIRNNSGVCRSLSSYWKIVQAVDYAFVQLVFLPEVPEGLSEGEEEVASEKAVRTCLVSSTNSSEVEAPCDGVETPFLIFQGGVVGEEVLEVVDTPEESVEEGEELTLGGGKVGGNQQLYEIAKVKH